jgi:hypothetical protein
MAGNAAPIFSRVGDIQWSGAVLTANTAMDGTGTVVTIFTSDATNGGRVEKIRAIHLGTNVAGLIRVFINNGSTNTVAANNALYAELAMPANTLSQTAASIAQEFALPLVLPPGYKLNATVGTTVAAGYQITAPGGKF